MKFRFLAENKTESPLCTAEHGLSIYIETHGYKLLFDTGASKMFADNAKQLDIDLSRIEALIISHGHYDHTGGVPVFCQQNAKASIYMHKDGFRESYGLKGDDMEKQSCGIRWTEQERNVIKPRIHLTDRLLWISDDIVVSGYIPNQGDGILREKFYVKNSNGTFEEDSMSHEQILVVREVKGIYVFSGCSHKGIIPAIEYAKEIFPGEQIAGLIGGMHLYSADEKTRAAVIEQVRNYDIDMIVPVHCTGMEAICALKSALGSQCIIASAGAGYGY